MKPATTVGVFFLALIAFVHLLRVLIGWNLIIADTVIPMWPSVVAFLVFSGIAAMLWREGHLRTERAAENRDAKPEERETNAQEVAVELSDDWKLAKFKVLHSDIWWSKDQGWKSLQWVVVLLAAIFAAKEKLDGLPAETYAAAAGLAGAFGVLYQVHLYRFASGTRRRLQQTVPPAYWTDSSEMPAARHELYLAVQVVVVAVATALVVVGIL